jgi:hypothetical protein
MIQLLYRQFSTIDPEQTTSAATGIGIIKMGDI